MKNCDIHNGLDKKDLRDFVGKHIFDDTGDHYIKSLEAQITDLKDRVKKARIALGIRELAESLGWEGFDVSDDIEDYSYDTYFRFVGTKAEYKKQITSG